MTTDNTLPAQVSDLVQIELAKYLPDAYPIADVTSEILPGANGENYIRTTVILEDGHPELDGRALNKFTLHIDPLYTATGARSRYDGTGRSNASSGQLDGANSRRPSNPHTQAARHPTFSSGHPAGNQLCLLRCVPRLTGQQRRSAYRYPNRPADAWIRVYRGLNHNHVRSQLQQNRTRLSVDARTFADLFCEIQDERHTADYNPLATFTAETATTWLTKAETAIADFLETSRTEHATIAILTLVRTR